jgi:ubiquilin
MMDMMASMMAQPGVIDSIVASNPMLQQMMAANPSLRNMLSNPEFVRSMLNPQMMQAAMRMQQVGGGACTRAWRGTRPQHVPPPLNPHSPAVRATHRRRGAPRPHRPSPTSPIACGLAPNVEHPSCTRR